MRLGTAIAIELAVAASAIGGVVFAIGAARDAAGAYLTSHDAIAATLPSLHRTPQRLPEATLVAPVPPPAARTIFDKPDLELLAPLAGPLVRVKTNKGGTSLSLRLDFASGARASFKPEQTHPQSDPRREIAAYRIDRMLGIGHVAPAKSMAFRVDELLAATDPILRQYMTERLEDEAIAREGTLRGEVQWWIPEIKVARIGPYDLDEKLGIERWQGYLQPNAPGFAKLAPEMRDYLAQIATLVVFDVLIDNADRWSGANTRTSPDGKTLYFMDNTLSFSPYTYGHSTNLGPLRAIGVFPRQLIERVRALDEASLTAALAGPDDGGLGPLLTPVEIRAILARRDHVVKHVDDLIATFGEAAVLALP